MANDIRDASPLVKFLFARLFPLPFIIVGGIALYFGVQAVMNAKASSDWPTVEGVVKISEVVSQSSDDGVTYKAEVMYSYVVEDMKYSSNNVAFGGFSSSDPSDAQEIVNKYPAGTIVTVAYDPSEPKESTLETGTTGGTYLMAIIGGIFFIVGLAMFIFLPRLIYGKKKEQKEDSNKNNDSNHSGSSPSSRYQDALEGNSVDVSNRPKPPYQM